MDSSRRVVETVDESCGKPVKIVEFRVNRRLFQRLRPRKLWITLWTEWMNENISPLSPRGPDA